MDASAGQNGKRARHSRILLRGESVVASMGLCVAAIVLFVMAGSAWWTARAQHLMGDDARTDTLYSVADLLAQLTAELLDEDNVSQARLLIAETARKHDLLDCRIVLPAGEVVAAARASDITLASLPETWADDDDARHDAPVTTADRIVVNCPVTIPGRGRARLTLVSPRTPTTWSIGDTQAGIGIIGTLALTALLMVYRRVRDRVRAISYIRESLLAIDAGEASLAALTVREDLGPEAGAWNELLAERESLRQVLVTKRLLELPSARQERSHDLSNMCDAMSQGLILVDDNLQINYANGAAALYLGAARENLLGATVDRALMDEQILEPVRSIASGALRRSKSVEIEDNTRDTRTILRFGIRPVRRDDECAAMIVIEDVTQQRLASDSRNSFVEQLSHEFRAPLVNILLRAEMAMEHGETDHRVVAECLNAVNQEAKRLERLVDDILSVAEIEAGTHKIVRDDVALATLFDDIRIVSEASAREKNLALSFDLPPKLPVIQADRDKVAMAIHNLVGNAIKYTPAGGRVTVEVECPNEGLLVKVADNGIGISDEDQARVFDKFYRAEDERIAGITGSGLGLAIAREVIRLHGGDITVESEVNHGSTFVLTVPAAPVVA